MAPSYKVMYFDARGRGEAVRMLLHLAGEKFEDQRLTFAEWPEIKKTLPFGHLPMLKVDDTYIWDSQAIVQHLGRKFGFAGKNMDEDVRASMFSMVIGDLQMERFKWRIYEPDKEKSAEGRKKFYGEGLPSFMKTFEEEFKRNKDGKGYLSGDSLTFADIVCYCVVVDIEKEEPGCLDEYPCVKGLLARVEDNPKIKQWVNNRPQTEI